MESRHALSDYDMIGFTLQYEMSYTNILAMMRLGGVTLLSRERGEREPVVVAGGPCAFNPEPLADFIDAFMIGDGEEVTLQVTAAVRDWKHSDRSRLDLLKTLAKIPGVYVPAFYDVEYDPEGRVLSVRPNCPEAPEKVKKCVIPDLNTTYYPRSFPVPYTEVVFDRIMLEIMRGCTRGCRFCQAGMLYRPVRERSLETLRSLAKDLERPRATRK